MDSKGGNFPDEVEEISSKASLPIQTARAMKVESQQDVESGAELIRVLKDLQEAVNKVFKPVVEQAYKAHKAAKEAQNTYLQPLVEAEALLRSRINTFVTKEEQRRRMEEEKRNRLASIPPPQLSASPLTLRVVPPPPAPMKIEGMSIREEWRWKVVDLSAIPADFWILDVERIDKHVKAGKGKTEIPGIEVFCTNKAAVKK